MCYHGEEIILVYSSWNLTGLELCGEELHPLSSYKKTYFILPKTNPRDKEKNLFSAGWV